MVSWQICFQIKVLLKYTNLKYNKAIAFELRLAQANYCRFRRNLEVFGSRCIFSQSHQFCQNNRTFTPFSRSVWLKMRTEPDWFWTAPSAFFLFSLFTTVSVSFNMHNWLCLPGDSVWKCAQLPPHLKCITSPPSLWTLAFDRAFQCGRSTFVFWRGGTTQSLPHFFFREAYGAS